MLPHSKMCEEEDEEKIRAIVAVAWVLFCWTHYI